MWRFSMLKETEWNTINSILLEIYTIKDIDIMAEKLLKMFRMLIPYSNGYFVVLDKNQSIINDKSFFIGFDEQKKHEYINYFYEKDYLTYVYDIITETTVYRDTDIIEEGVRTKTEFYRHFLMPLKIPYGAGILLVRYGKLIGIINLFRNKELGDFTDKDIYILGVLKKHLANIIYNLLNDSNSEENQESKLEKLYNEYNLSDREKEVTSLIKQGKANSDISDEMMISISTVKKHIYNIYGKFNVKSRTQLLAYLSEKIDN
ncbi:helix-turn-helix transcriptional regulator [Lachnospiraceae bacterium MD1]|uniref:Helix-turn-helix transcriptional regulator n=2 Tax=Variimorphobacter saccharofermentans TaxID=2755051 RepID=A0A839K3N6_9FIRM|nr:helix-turn-helix transcriptional regulator [Variimorphobacter saccharofermentans]